MALLPVSGDVATTAATLGKKKDRRELSTVVGSKKIGVDADGKDIIVRFFLNPADKASEAYWDTAVDGIDPLSVQLDGHDITLHCTRTPVTAVKPVVLNLGK
ncbi:hypothetical protein FACS1894103_0750 [Campylobacterota bacterium]|nr:hypothetical protein FACS1894103_0750 [Campylobacterota bacterium]